MTNEAKSLYLKKIQKRYKNSSKKEKSKILDEYIEVCGYSRNYAIKKLSKSPDSSLKRRGRKSVYDFKTTYHLVALWKVMRMCSKRMKAAMPLWLEYYEHPQCDQEVRMKLLSMSTSTMDRLLRPFKDKMRRGKSSTESFVKNNIPIELLNAKVTEPGFIESDTVIHCGNSMLGKYAVSLTMTDLFSGWTENRAVWTKHSGSVLEKIKDIRSSLPFRMKGFASDNGSEFLTRETVKYFNDNRHGRVKFVRRRPYKKNDNAHVEQKNDTHVRQLFGYARLDNPDLIDIMNDIYKNYWNPFNNFFCPVMKLEKKYRHGARIRKKYDEPKTPYERLLASEKLTELQKQNLKLTMEGINPIKMRATLEQKMRLFTDLLSTDQIRGGAFDQTA